MRDKLYWNTVTPLLRKTLLTLMACEFFEPFRLVCGTSLSLQLGHRTSVDIDLFTDAAYDSIDFRQIDSFLKNNFPYVSLPMTPVGLGQSYVVGNHEQDAVKLDVYYTDPFIEPALSVGECRLATIHEIIAMKMDIVQRGGRKKDFWDLHELLSQFTIDEMIAFHKTRYPYAHDEDIIRKNLSEFSKADDDFDPVCLRGKYWELIKLDFFQALYNK